MTDRRSINLLTTNDRTIRIQVNRKAKVSEIFRHYQSSIFLFFNFGLRTCGRASDRCRKMHRFVRESETSVENVPKRQTYSVAIADGEEARTEYEQVLQMPSTAEHQQPKPNELRKLRSHRPSRKSVPFDENLLFRAATVNDISTIEQMKIPRPMLINACDQFGWTALMMASYEGHLDVIKVLIRLGADINRANNQMETALTLAERAKHQAVVEFLKQALEPICLSDSDDDADDADKVYFCDICKTDVPIGDRKTHETSTLHRFNRTDSLSTVPRFGIPESNVGFQMLVQQGWKRDHGLGPQQNGQMYPVKTTLRKPRSGLGVRQSNKPKVTHFKPFDCDAIKSIAAPPPASAAKLTSTKTKRQIRNEQSRARRKERYLRKLLS